jgi:hypothetical protein
MIRLTQWKHLIACGAVAASAAHADSGASPAAAVQMPLDRECAASAGSKPISGFQAGTTFMLTDNGLVVLKLAAPKKWYSSGTTAEPEFPNTGN